MFWLLRYAQWLCSVVGFVLLAARHAGVACAARSIVANCPIFVLEVALRAG
ncbi:hypothetical protein A2U01_0119368, partial [Trifolium medium]|nr:hypothetical protein [Trifolium medium]